MKKKDLIVKVGCEVEQCNISPVKMIASSGILVWDQRVTEYRVRGACSLTKIHTVVLEAPVWIC